MIRIYLRCVSARSYNTDRVQTRPAGDITPCATRSAPIDEAQVLNDSGPFLPTALPNIITRFRVGGGSRIPRLIFAEMIAAARARGFILRRQPRRGRPTGWSLAIS